MCDTPPAGDLVRRRSHAPATVASPAGSGPARGAWRWRHLWTSGRWSGWIAVNHEPSRISTLPTDGAGRHVRDGPVRALIVDGRPVGYTSPNAATRRLGCPL